MATRPSVGFIGAGKVATALGHALAGAGYRVVAIASRTRAPAGALAASIPGAQAFATAQEVVDAADLVFITTPDAAVRGLAASLRWRPGQPVVHTSGAESRAALAAAAEQGALTGSFHPLQTFAASDSLTADLRGTIFGVEAGPALRDLLAGMAADLGGRIIELRPEDKVLYHAAAVFVSNYTVTLMKLATDLWQVFGQDRREALRSLLPLLKGTVANLESLGLPGALTGPIARGDVDTVEGHLSALAERAPDALSAYRALALQTIPAALAQSALSAADARRLRTALGAACGRMEEPPVEMTLGPKFGESEGTT